MTAPARTATTTLTRPFPTSLVVIVLLHVVGWGSLIVLVAPRALTLGSSAGGAPVVFGLGVGLTAYALGMRHAFDADHIAAIDNTTRRLLARQKPAHSVGFWFSLGHSSIVVILCVLLALGIRSLGAQLTRASSPLHQWTGVIGPSVSGVFLILIGVLNLVAVIATVRAVKRFRQRGPSTEADRFFGEPSLRASLISRLVFRLNKGIHDPRQMYFIGLLFGLGFDTATEIGLLALAGTASAAALPWYAILTLPILFAAGMSLLDTAQGFFMRRAYGWAEKKNSRAMTYNLVVTSVSVVIALSIGIIELSGVLSSQFSLAGPIKWLGTADLNSAGIVLTVVILVAWGVFAVVQARDRARSS
jgi:high-affinity nickel-transport protein